MDESLCSLVNGVRSDQISTLDRGLLYGDGIFETIAVIDGLPQRWERHLQRLFFGATQLALPVPDGALLRDEAERLCDSTERAVLKIILTRGVGHRGYAPLPTPAPTRILSLLPWPTYPATNASVGVDVRLCATRLACQPRLAGLKHLNRLEQVLARAEWRDDFAEGLMLDADGHVIEGTMSNLFIAVDRLLCTPDLSRCGVAGIMRALVLEQAALQGLPVQITSLVPDDLLVADEMFITNSIIGLWPVKRFADRKYGIGDITQTIQKTLAQECGRRRV